MPKDYYQILGLERGASAGEIKKSYRKLSKQWHPDKHKGEKDAETKFKEINEAYETLNDPKKKQMYDQFGTTGGAQGFGSGQGGFGGFDFNNINFGDGQGGGFSDIFESFFGGGMGGQSRGRPADKRGSDLEVAVEIPFSEVVTGAEKTFKLDKLINCKHCKGSGMEPGSKMVTCSTCSGTGQITRTAQSFFGTIQQSSVCPDCKGAGQTPEKACKDCSGEGRKQQKAEVKINIPAGIHDGQTLRLRAEGNAGLQGSASGDLYVQIRVRPDPKFERDEDDIKTALKIPVINAILGTEIEVETVHGQVKLNIPAGTQPGQVLRVKGKGLPVLSSSKTGDHYVTVNVEIPTRLSRKEKELLEEWKNNL